MDEKEIINKICQLNVYRFPCDSGYGCHLEYGGKIKECQDEGICSANDYFKTFIMKLIQIAKLEALEKFKKETGSISGFKNSKNISNKELLELYCDVLVPAALENQITKENAGNINAKIILELANGPTTTEADDILFSKNIPVIPDILANAGGVTVSTFEWEQNLKNEKWTREEVLEKLKVKMFEAAQKVFATSQELSTDLRRAAFAVAIKRLEEKV